MPKILVVDDDDGVRTVIARMLETAGHEVTEARTGKEGLDAVASTTFDLAITDIYMPEVDGIEFIGRVMQEPSHPRLIVISGGGHADAATATAVARQLGVRWTLQKPFDMDQLLTLVDVALAP